MTSIISTKAVMEYVIRSICVTRNVHEPYHTNRGRGKRHARLPG